MQAAFTLLVFLPESNCFLWILCVKSKTILSGTLWIEKILYLQYFFKKKKVISLRLRRKCFSVPVMHMISHICYEEVIPPVKQLTNLCHSRMKLSGTAIAYSCLIPSNASFGDISAMNVYCFCCHLHGKYCNDFVQTKDRCLNFILIGFHFKVWYYLNEIFY